MRVRASIAALACLFLCGVAVQCQTQAPSQAAYHVSQLVNERIEVSKLDWIILTARVRMLEQIMAHESLRSVSSVGMAYDTEKKRVVVKGFVDPDWIANAKVDDARILCSSTQLASAWTAS